jgi:hypothetical protein
MHLLMSTRTSSRRREIGWLAASFLMESTYFQDQRDYIYGLLGIVHEDFRVLVYYESTAIDVFNRALWASFLGWRSRRTSMQDEADMESLLMCLWRIWRCLIADQSPAPESRDFSSAVRKTLLRHWEVHCPTKSMSGKFKRHHDTLRLRLAIHNFLYGRPGTAT